MIGQPREVLRPHLDMGKGRQQDPFRKEGKHTLLPLCDNEEGVCGVLYDHIPYYFARTYEK